MRPFLGESKHFAVVHSRAAGGCLVYFAGRIRFVVRDCLRKNEPLTDFGVGIS